MVTRKIHGYPILILGAGRGGSALLEMFIGDELVEVVGIADPDWTSPGIKIAKKHGIPVYADAIEALQACKDYQDCIVYNLTHDDSIAEAATQILGNNRVTSGLEAKLFWQMVTNLKRIKRDLENSQDQLKAVINHAMDGIITINESGEIHGFNPAAEQIFGYSQQHALGKNVKILIPEPVKSEDGTYGQTSQEWNIRMRGREVMAVRENGEQFPIELSASEMVLNEQSYFIFIVRDITERKLAEQKIAHMAHHDYLTGLPNRVLFLDRLEQAITLARRSSHKYAVLFLDLDGFKCINDKLGHDAGDMLLQEVAKRLKGLVRTSDTVARVGGDEFTFVLNNIEADESAALVAKKIILALSEPFDLKGQRCQVGGSIGIAIFPDSSKDFETLLVQADRAMYLAKQQGKNTYKFYEDVLNQ